MQKISVVMATYNGEKFIKEQINSIKSQIRQPDEVIIADDCSTDSTIDIIETFIKENNLLNWTIIKNEKNLGFIKNFHHLISVATGDIIFTCDQDDVWCDDKIESLARIFTKYDEIMAVSTSFTQIDSDGYDIKANDKHNYGLIKIHLKRPLQKINLKTIMHSNISPGCTSAFRKNVADIYVSLADFNLPHDYEINIIAASLNGLYFYNFPLIKYRLHENNLLGMNGKEQTRLEIAKEKTDASAIIMGATQSTKIYDMFSKRFSILNSRNLLKIISLNFKKTYHRFFSIKERFGDILYVFKGK